MNVCRCLSALTFPKFARLGLKHFVCENFDESKRIRVSTADVDICCWRRRGEESTLTSQTLSETGAEHRYVKSGLRPAMISMWSFACPIRKLIGFTSRQTGLSMASQSRWELAIGRMIRYHRR